MDNDTLSALSRAQLAQLGREYMLAAQFNSRAGYAAVRINHGDSAYKDVAIDNWMAASPVYTRRMQRAMHLDTGSDIATICKGLQLECGFSHQYFDVHFRELSDHEGEFWLASCGPLLETEPRGDDAVKTMCHDVEDPTFEATAVATNPRTRVVPIHRPPRVPADREPHCHWRIVIEPDAEPVQEIALTGVMRDTQLARIELARPANGEPGGLDYYDGPLLEQVQLERFSHAALVLICKELAVQYHLLVNSLGLVVSERYGPEAAAAVAEFQMTGACRVTSERLARWLGVADGGIDAVLAVLALHPAVQPAEYTTLSMRKLDERRARVAIDAGLAARESRPLGWFPLLQRGRLAGLESLLQGVDRRARLVPEPGRSLAWVIDIAEAAVAADDPLPVQIARGTLAYRTVFENHIPLLEVTR